MSSAINLHRIKVKNLLSETPDMSIREVAAVAEISMSTALKLVKEVRETEEYKFAEMLNEIFNAVNVKHGIKYLLDEEAEISPLMREILNCWKP